MTRDEAYELFLEWRGIEPHEVCPKCRGSGKVTYGNTSTWRGGIGGCMMTPDVCDKCWGTGSREKPGVDLRKYERLTRDHEALQHKYAKMMETHPRKTGH